jgi:hypothetical protein
MQRKKMHHIFCLFVGQMEAQIPIGEIDHRLVASWLLTVTSAQKRLVRLIKYLPTFTRVGSIRCSFCCVLTSPHRPLHSSAPPKGARTMPSDLLWSCRRVPVGMARSGSVQGPRGCLSSEEQRTRRKTQEACSASQDWRRRKRRRLNLAWLRGIAGVILCIVVSCCDALTPSSGAGGCRQGGDNLPRLALWG